MPFEILTAEGDGARRWSALIGRLPAERRDIHFLPEYGWIYRDSYGFEPLLAAYSEGDEFILQPFVRRSLRDLPFLSGAPDAATFSDIANPYGYGGPLANTSNSKLYSPFAEAFAAWCDKEDIASEFASLHPLMADHQLALIGKIQTMRHEKEVVFIDLSKGEEGILAGVNRGHRSSINKARRANVRVEKVEPSAKNLAVFDEIYRQTMVRRNAATRWFVPDNFFANCCTHLGGKRASLFFAFIGDDIECAYLLIHDFDVAYYYFAGMRPERSELRVNNLMMYETAVWAQKAGYKRYYLGGGVTSADDDSLLRFKSGFSGLRAPLYTYFCVRDQAAYDRLGERKREHEVATTGAESSSNFLPIYRR